MKTTKPNKLAASACSFVLLQLLSSSLSANPENCTYTWTAQNSGTTNLFESVEAVSDMICWAAGNNATVRRTTDGGITWLDANPNPGIITGNVVHIEALDASNAWATSHLTNMMSFIYKTTNGGNDWVQVYSISQIFLHGVHMTSLMNGFAFGDPVSSTWRILTTTNGGLNWNQLPTAPSGPPPAQGFRKSFQVSLPNIWFGSYPATIIRSTNSGINWSQHTVPGNGMSTILSIHFNSQILGFAGSINMVRSTDGGTTYLQHSVPGLGNINSVEGFDNELWYVRGQYIYYSADSGNNWTQVFNAGITQSDIDLQDNPSGCLTGWAVGYGGTITKMTEDVVGINTNNSLPKEFSLEQNYPNPFNPSTIIRYSIPEANHVNITVYNILGKEVTRLINSNKQAGNHEVEFNAENLSSGMYIYRIESGRFAETRKMLLIK